MRTIKLLLLLLGYSLLSCKAEKVSLNNLFNGKIDTIQISKENIEYCYEDKLYIQIVELKRLSPDKIHFIIETKNKKLKLTSIIKGIAQKDTSSIPESDEGIGYGYPSYEYYSKNGNCEIYLRLEVENEQRLKLEQVGCDVIGVENGLFSLDVLLKKK